jgi:hypothetical protein
MLRRIRHYVHLGWRAVTEFHTAQWAAASLLSLLPAGALAALAAFWGEHSVTLIVMIFVVTLCAVGLLFLGLFGSVSAPIPVYRPTKSSERATPATPSSAPPAMPQQIEYSDLSDLIERWFNDHFRGVPVDWSVAQRAKENLKPLVRSALFSRFAGSGSYVTGELISDRAKYPGNPHVVSYSAILSRDVDVLRVFVEPSSETDQGQWTTRNRLLLAEFQNQTRNQRVAFPVIVAATALSHGQSALNWGDGSPFACPAFCRARLVVRGDDKSEQYYYFILVTPRHQREIVYAVDQRNLEFPDRWFAEDQKAAALRR